LNSGTSFFCHSWAKASLAIIVILTGSSAVPNPPPSADAGSAAGVHAARVEALSKATAATARARRRSRGSRIMQIISSSS
jgi:hypothetical protein